MKQKTLYKGALLLLAGIVARASVNVQEDGSLLMKGSSQMLNKKMGSIIFALNNMSLDLKTLSIQLKNCSKQLSSLEWKDKNIRKYSANSTPQLEAIRNDLQQHLALKIQEIAENTLEELDTDSHFKNMARALLKKLRAGRDPTMQDLREMVFYIVQNIVKPIALRSIVLVNPGALEVLNAIIAPKDEERTVQLFASSVSSVMNLSTIIYRILQLHENQIDWQSQGESFVFYLLPKDFASIKFASRALHYMFNLIFAHKKDTTITKDIKATLENTETLLKSIDLRYMLAEAASSTSTSGMQMQ
ncbi:uncharacterized protein NEMAJ01_0473 [Nematocida major]|uniref:uncharacterized protein n=1 Tax=Nematocida major TaxID=1912982 RepID=UPI002008BA74|nr:uncharacterized protein NEMAJ01_0473 [Nematocida major]KAH9385577.1 hypothetical protein NEMAJ01_0473 [Nematocida major]